MLVHKGGQINNVQLITDLRIAKMSQRQGGYVQRMEVIVKRTKSQGEGGVRVDVNGEVKLLCLFFFFCCFFCLFVLFVFFWGGVGLRGGGGGGGGSGWM